MLPFADITPFSSVDWPGKLVATLFTQGCPLRCPYCYNADMQTAYRAGEEPDTAFGWGDATEFLRRRVGLLDGVVFSGGEPLLHADLPHWMAWCKEAGFAVGLHTSGVLPKRLQQALPYLDWVGFDIKTERSRYGEICSLENAGEAVYESLAMVLDAGVEYEIRTVKDPGLVSSQGLEMVRDELACAGVREWLIKPVHVPV